MLYEHTAHIFQKPKRGTAFIKQYPVVNYSHRKVARGGDDSAACSIRCDPVEGQRIFSEFLGNLVQFYAESPVTPIWEGYISRVTLRTGGVTATISLDDMANTVRVVYYNSNSAAAIKTESTNNVVFQDSVDIYGTKQGVFDAGIHYNNADKTHKTTLRDTLRIVRGNPQNSIMSNDQVEGTTVELELKGLKDFAWGWQNYDSTDTTLATASALFSEITVRSDLFIYPTNAPLVYSIGVAGSDATQNILTNATFNMSHESRSGQTYWQFLQSIAEAGDGSAQYTFGISRSNIFTSTRFVYYRPASTTLKYTAKAYQDAGYIRDLGGRILPGYLVEPDAVIRVDDLLPNWLNPGKDPSLAYIEEINYDGDTGRITWSSGDNATLDSVLGGGRYFKKSGLLFGAPVRQTL